jgi:DNA-binding SARP family transcriptional activator
MTGITSTDQADQPDRPLEVRVLGEFTVLRGGEELALPPSKKTRALLAYLAVVERSQQRERLCRMFWDLPDDPRGALRWSLSKLRQVTNADGCDCLVADRNSVMVRGQSIDLDLRRVKTIASGDLALVDIAGLERAAALFRGGFLDDLALPRCPDFEAWRTSHVNELELTRVRILRMLVDRLGQEPSRALPYAHALQAMHPTDDTLAAAARTLAARAREAAVAMPPPSLPAADPAPRPAPPTTPQLASVPSSEIETQHVTVASIEIVSPLHAFAAMDPELLSRQIDPLLDTAIAIVEEHGGTVSASADTGITAVFGAPPTAEHHAISACRAVLSVKSEVEHQSQGSVRVRAGLDTGEVIVRRRRSGTSERVEVSGVAARSAARLARSLRRGVLAATERTHAAVAGIIAMVRLPRADFPTFDRDQQAYELRNPQAGQ